jgi:hypothetical protein
MRSALLTLLLLPSCYLQADRADVRAEEANNIDASVDDAQASGDSAADARADAPDAKP